MAKRLTEEELKRSMHERIDHRAARLHRHIESGKIGTGGEGGRIWLDQYAVGTGLDICCGDFLVGMAAGVDHNNAVLGASWRGVGDELVKSQAESQDFVVCNYLDAFSSPLKVLHEWHRVLKHGGICAVVVPNANKYKGKLGALDNSSKNSVFTRRTLKNYFCRAGFRVDELEEVGSEIRLSTTKL